MEVADKPRRGDGGAGAGQGGGPGRVPGLRAYLAVLGFSSAGREAYFVIMSWLLIETTGSPQYVALLLICISVVDILLGTTLGTLCDRVDRRRLLACADLVRACAFLVFPLLLPAWGVLPAVYLCAATYTLADRLHLLAGHALVLDIAPAERLAGTNARGMTAFQIGGLVGSAGAGVLLAVMEAGSAALAVALCFATSCAAALMIPGNPPRAGAAVPAGEALPPGRSPAHLYRTLSRRSVLVNAVGQALIFSSAYLFNALLASFIHADFGQDAALFGIVAASWSGGAIAISALAARWGGPAWIRLALRFGALAMGVALIAFGLNANPAGLVFLSALLGLLFAMVRTSHDTELQLIAGVRQIGRTKGAVQTLVSCFGLVIYGTVALFGDAAGPQLGYAAFGTFVAAAGLALLAVRASDPGPAAIPGERMS